MKSVREVYRCDGFQSTLIKGDGELFENDSIFAWPFVQEMRSRKCQDYLGATLALHQPSEKGIEDPLDHICG